MGLFKKKTFKLRNDGKKKALLVGINYTGTTSALRGCINDVADVKKMLLTQGYQEQDIRVMTDDTREQPTKHRIMIGLLWLLDNKENKEVDLFFHYSGHGSWTVDRSGDEVDGRDEALCPLDYQRNGLIYDDVLKKFIQDRITPKAKLYCLIDACHSGTIFDLRFNVSVDEIKTEGDNINASFKVEAHAYDNIQGNICVLSGCEDSETSADAYIAGRFQGALTHSFLQALQMNSYNVTYEKLMKDIYQVIKTGNYNQNPTMSSNRTVVFENDFKL